MELRVKSAAASNRPRNVWEVSALGFSGDADRTNEKVAYLGADGRVAARTVLEIQALSALFHTGRAGFSCNYSTIVAPLFEASDPEDESLERSFAPFAWARRCWSRDETFDESIDATLESARVVWIDARGDEYDVEVLHSQPDRAFLSSVPTWTWVDAESGAPYPVRALTAGLARLELDWATPPVVAKPRSAQRI